MRMKIKNRILASVLSFLIIIATAFSGVTTAKAAEGDVGNEQSSTGSLLETGKTYRVPLYFYALDGDAYKEVPSQGGIIDYIDNVALVRKNDDGSFNVTLQVENYDKIDFMQFSKPGAIPDDTKPLDIKLGDYNIPESFIFTDSANTRDSVVETLSSNYISEDWNDKYIQNITVKKSDAGVSWCSFDASNIDSKIFVSAFRSFECVKRRGTYSYTSCIDAMRHLY